MWSGLDEDLLFRHKVCCRNTRKKWDVGSCCLISTPFNCCCWREGPGSGPLKEEPAVSWSKFCLCSLSDGIGRREEKQGVILRYQQTRRSTVSLQGVWFFEILKSPQRNWFHQLNRYPHSKAPHLVSDVEGEGWGGREGGRCRHRADTIKTLKNGLLNTSIKKYKTWPHF